MAIPEWAMPLVRKVRARMRDYAALNRLTVGVQHLDEQIHDALLDAVEDWNTSPPLLAAVTLQSHPNVNLLVSYAQAALLDQAISRLEEENLPITTAGGVRVDKGATIQLLSVHRARIVAEYETKRDRHKAAQNLNEALGDRSQSVESPYKNLY